MYYLDCAFRITARKTIENGPPKLNLKSFKAQWLTVGLRRSTPRGASGTDEQHPRLHAVPGVCTSRAWSGAVVWLRNTRDFLFYRNRAPLLQQKNIRASVKDQHSTVRGWLQASAHSPGAGWLLGSDYLPFFLTWFDSIWPTLDTDPFLDSDCFHSDENYPRTTACPGRYEWHTITFDK